MPMYNKASLAKKPKATKKTPLSERPVKKVPIKRPSVKKEEVAKKNRVAFEPLKKSTTKKTPKPKSRGGR